MNFPVAAVDFGAAKNSTREKKTSVCIPGSWSDVNWGISDSCKPEMNVLSPLHINYSFTPTKYIVLTCSFRTRSTWAIEKENILWTFFYDRRWQRRNIERKQQTDISDKKWRKPSVNFNIDPSLLFSNAVQSQENLNILWTLQFLSKKKHPARTDVTRHHCC